MSATPLIETEQMNKILVRKEKYITYQLFESEFQGWTAKAELEWDTDEGYLKRYWLKIQNPKQEKNWKIGEVDGKSEEFFGPVTSFEMSFSGVGRMGVEAAKEHLDTLNVTLKIAEELQKRLKGKGFPMPQIEEMDKTIALKGAIGEAK